MVDIKDLSLVSAAPSSLTSDAECEALLRAMTTQFRKVAAAIDRLPLLANIDRQPSEVVDALAYHFHVDFYDASLPLETRRALVKNHNEWHLIKGTPAAVERIIQTVFGDGELVEWFEREDMEPYTFEIHTSNAEAAENRMEELIAAVNAVKNVRSHLVRVAVSERAAGSIYIGGTLTTYEEIKMKGAF